MVGEEAIVVGCGSLLLASRLVSKWRFQKVMDPKCIRGRPRVTIVLIMTRLNTNEHLVCLGCVGPFGWEEK